MTSEELRLAQVNLRLMLHMHLPFKPGSSFPFRRKMFLPRFEGLGDCLQFS